MANAVEFDFSKPSIPQVYNMGKEYETWTNVQVKGKRLIIFGGTLEWFTYTATWHPLAWIPVSLWLTRKALVDHDQTLTHTIIVFLVGLFALWPLFEYSAHRWVFHFPIATIGRGWANVMHFLMHGIHHKTPNDHKRLLIPLVLGIVFAIPIYTIMRLAAPPGTSNPLMGGFLIGYLIYDYYHLYSHTPGRKPQRLRTFTKKHLAHHGRQHCRYFAVSPLAAPWDIIMGTG